MNRLNIVVLAIGLALAGCGKDDPSSNANPNNSNNASNTPNNDNNASNTPNNESNTPNNETNQNNPMNAMPNNGTQNNTTGSNNATNNASNNATNNATNNTTNNMTGGACAGAMPTACFQNSDCPDDQRCEDLMGDDNPCCVVGARGTKTVGEQCTSENECDTAICIARNNDPAICSQACDMDNPCPDPLECQPVLGLCVTPDP